MEIDMTDQKPEPMTDDARIPWCSGCDSCGINPGPTSICLPAVREMAAIVERLPDRLAAYEWDEPHDADTVRQINSIDNWRKWLDGEHSGDCNNQPHPCLRCYAENVLRKVEYLISETVGGE